MDRITRFLIWAACFLILIAFLSPLIFTSNSFFPAGDFSNKGQIGDTIGGIMNPFIGIVGAIVTFLAFYIQLRANDLAREQFTDGLKEEKEKIERFENNEYIHILKLISIDLNTVIDDIKLKGTQLKEYYEAINADPYKSVFLSKSPLFKYKMLNDIERLSVFKSYSKFMKSKDSWITEFSTLYNISNFLPDLYNFIYDKYDGHSSDIFDRKSLIHKDLNDFMNNLTRLINDYKARYSDDYLNKEASSISNDTIFNYYKLTQVETDPDEEVDLRQVSERILKTFIENAIYQRNHSLDYDRNLEPLVEQASNSRKSIKQIENHNLFFSKQIEENYNSLIIQNGKNKSYLDQIVEVRESLLVETKNVG